MNQRLVQSPPLSTSGILRESVIYRIKPVSWRTFQSLQMRIVCLASAFIGPKKPFFFSMRIIYLGTGLENADDGLVALRFGELQ